MRLFALSSILILLAACNRASAVDPAEAAAVDAAVRALVTGYASATDGSQAESAITLFSTSGFVERIKAQVKTCRTAAQAGGELPATCARDPIFCGEGPATLANVVVKNAAAGVASAEVSLTNAAGPVTALVALAKVDSVWKVDSVTCAQ